MRNHNPMKYSIYVIVYTYMVISIQNNIQIKLNLMIYKNFLTFFKEDPK